ncbi:uncharacterized protein [Haliotis cracherodii]|uniref:uncharacterized protein n=1 Tax=Haliotis cracherodii TaxID=6455 RepID=UPI0039E93444
MAVCTLLLLLVCLARVHGHLSGADVLCQKHLAERGHGLFPVPGTCNMFVLCSYSQNQTQFCPSATFWSNDINSCQQVNLVSCPYDPCRSRPDKYQYPDVDSCYNYYVCGNRRSHHARCQPGERFDASSSMCVRSRSCFLRQQYCDTMRPSHDPHKFYSGSQLGWTLMSCPTGLVYNTATCQCTYTSTRTSTRPSAPPSPECVNDFYFPYDGSMRESRGRIHQAKLGSVGVSDQKAIFHGAGSLEIPFLVNSDFRPQFALSFKFRVTSHESRRGNGMALVGNGCNGARGTLRMFIRRRTVTLHVTVSGSDTAFVRSIHDVNVTSETAVHLMRNNTIIRFKVGNREARPIYTNLHIKPITCALAIGMGNGLENFIGEFDDLLFYRCVPEGFMAG